MSHLFIARVACLPLLLALAVVEPSRRSMPADVPEQRRTPSGASDSTRPAKAPTQTWIVNDGKPIVMGDERSSEEFEAMDVDLLARQLLSDEESILRTMLRERLVLAELDATFVDRLAKAIGSVIRESGLPNRTRDEKWPRALDEPSVLLIELLTNPAVTRSTREDVASAIFPKPIVCYSPRVAEGDPLHVTLRAPSMLDAGLPLILRARVAEIRAAGATLCAAKGPFQSMCTLDCNMLPPEPGVHSIEIDVEWLVLTQSSAEPRRSGTLGEWLELAFVDESADDRLGIVARRRETFPAEVRRLAPGETPRERVIEPALRPRMSTLFSIRKAAIERGDDGKHTFALELDMLGDPSDGVPLLLRPEVHLGEQAIRFAPIVRAAVGGNRYSLGGLRFRAPLGDVPEELDTFDLVLRPVLDGDGPSLMRRVGEQQPTTLPSLDRVWGEAIWFEDVPLAWVDRASGRG